MSKTNVKNAELVVAYLEGRTIQVKYNHYFGADNEWLDIPAYTTPVDIYRLSCDHYSFRIKPE